MASYGKGEASETVDWDSLAQSIGPEIRLGKLRPNCGSPHFDGPIRTTGSHERLSHLLLRLCSLELSGVM